MSLSDEQITQATVEGIASGECIFDRTHTFYLARAVLALQREVAELRKGQKAADEDTALSYLERLMGCAELNQDDMEPETRELLDDIQDFLLNREKASGGAT